MLSDALRESARNLLAAKQRSFLAILGIVIGTASVIAMANIGAITEKHAIAQIAATGIDLVAIRLEQGENKGAAGLSLDKIEGLKSAIPELDVAIPVISGQESVSYRGRQLFATGIASDPALFDLLRLRLAEGRWISRFDGLEKFCVIGGKVAANQLDRNVLALPDVKVGDRLEIGSESFTIIGILAATPPSQTSPLDIGSSIFVAFGNAPRIAEAPRIDSVLGRMAAGASAEEIATRIQTFFQGLRPPLRVDIQTAQQMIAEMHDQAQTFGLLLGAIGGISLIVGGVGIMNVMLVSVTERRREIGLRVAVGARRRDIETMFLIEALALSSIGGLIGTAIGVGGSAIFAVVLGWAFTVAGDAIIAGVGVSMVVGIFFGIYPAISAARMSPVSALRAE